MNYQRQREMEKRKTGLPNAHYSQLIASLQLSLSLSAHHLIASILLYFFPCTSTFILPVFPLSFISFSLPSSLTPRRVRWLGRVDPRQVGKGTLTPLPASCLKAIQLTLAPMLGTTPSPPHGEQGRHPLPFAPIRPTQFRPDVAGEGIGTLYTVDGSY